MSALWAAVLLAWAAILLLTLAITGLIRQFRHMAASSVTGARVGFGQGLGHHVSEQVVDREGLRSSIILFASDDCSACHHIIPTFEELAPTQPDRDFVVVYPQQALRRGGSRVRVMEKREDLFELFDIPATPFLASIERDGSVGIARTPGSRSTLSQLVSQIGGQP